MKKSLAVLLVVLVLGSGCVRDKALLRINQEQAATIQSLNNEIQRLNAELDAMLFSGEELGRAKNDLENRLQDEMKAGDVSVSMEDRGLVVTMLNRVLFDSGKAILMDGARQSLDKVALSLQNQLEDNFIFVEGHTDNEPIRQSSWRSNWELSTARATEVIHYFVGEKNFDPVRLAATGYGEFQPVADNATEAGRMKNRRVEIIISPKKFISAGITA